MLSDFRLNSSVFLPLVNKVIYASTIKLKKVLMPKNL